MPCSNQKLILCFLQGLFDSIRYVDSQLVLSSTLWWGATSPVPRKGGQPLPWSCCPHYFWHQPGCHGPSCPPEHTLAHAQPLLNMLTSTPGPFPVAPFQYTLSAVWGCCEQSAGPSIAEPHATWPVNLACLHFSVKPLLWCLVKCFD